MKKYKPNKQIKLDDKRFKLVGLGKKAGGQERRLIIEYINKIIKGEIK